MQTLERGYRGLWLLVELNLDRAFTVLALSGALFLAGYIATL